MLTAQEQRKSIGSIDLRRWNGKTFIISNVKKELPYIEAYVEYMHERGIQILPNLHSVGLSNISIEPFEPRGLVVYISDIMSNHYIPDYKKETRESLNKMVTFTEKQRIDFNNTIDAQKRIKIFDYQW